ncbi:phage tail tube protein [Sulfitobacter sp. M22]|uniref:phage tail tube protein n=1 Tax=Sulfitobacter sp. M22 TaxID=2675332 RepID=UPI001F484471|nr:phage tail tube protein [Sulfitobacter sp. M22]MCF7725779.1 hypothetical protein [Sulfitobacter sp. M22]
MSKQIIAYGALTERSDDEGATWESIPECKGIAIPMVETDYQDVTSLDSPNGFREYIKGLKDAGVLSVPCGYTSAGYEQQLADQALDVPVLYRTTMRAAPGQATGDIFEFSGFPTPQVEGGDIGAPVEMTVSIRTTGDVEWTKGTAAT